MLLLINNLKKGKTYEEIIDEVLDAKSKKYSYRGYSWDNDSELSRLLGEGKTYNIWRKKKQGLSYEQIIDEVLDNKK